MCFFKIHLVYYFISSIWKSLKNLKLPFHIFTIYKVIPWSVISPTTKRSTAHAFRMIDRLFDCLRIQTNVPFYFKNGWTHLKQITLRAV